MSTVTIELPDPIRANIQELQELFRFVLETVAVEGYRREALSQRQVGELLGLNFWETEAFLKSREVYLHYDIGDFDKDLQALDRVRAANHFCPNELGP